jgi:hypothetical protein
MGRYKEHSSPETVEAISTDNRAPYAGYVGHPLGLSVTLLEKGGCSLREDNAPAIGCARRVLFDNRYSMRWIELLQKQGERETRRSATDDIDGHCVSPPHLMKVPCNLVDLFVSILPCGHGN